MSTTGLRRSSRNDQRVRLGASPFGSVTPQPANLSGDQWAQFFELAPDGFYLSDLSGTFMQGNRKTEELTGYERSELIGKNYLQLGLLPLFQVPKAIKLLALSALGRATGPDEFTIQKKDGASVTVEISTAPALINGSRMVLGVAREVLERKRRKTALLRNEERLRTIAEAMGDVIFRLSLEGRVTYVSPSVQQVLGFTAAETVGRHFKQFIHPDDRVKAGIAYEGLMHGQPIHDLQIHLLQKSRGSLWAELTVIPFALNDRLSEIQGVIRDVTARREAEEALRHSETRFREIADLLPQPLYETDLKCTITFTNRAGFEYFGYTPKDLLRGLSIMDMITPGEQQLALGNMTAILQGGPVRSNEYTALRKDGTTFPIIITSAPIVRDGRPVGLRGAILDITDRVRAEEHLRRSELMFRQLAETIHEVFWISDIATRNILYVSPAYREIFGRTCQSFYEQSGSFLESVHPGDAARVLAAMEQQEKGVPFDEAFRIVRPDRSVRWIRAQTFFVLNEKNENARIVGVAEDITDRKNAEDMLRTHASQLQALSSRLTEARETERRFIARELHDEIGQQLTGLKLSLDMMQSSLSEITGKQIHGLQVLAGDLMERVRNLSLDLRPSMLDDLGLLPALAWHFNRYHEQTGIRVAFSHACMEERFEGGIETAVYRVVQEALTNAARHAGVAGVAVSLSANDNAVHLVVSDEGKGFDPAEVLVRRQSVGLFGMRERVEAAGGDLAVRSAPGAGTTLTASIPLSPANCKRRHP
jgi:PAS domain S-box-containing protein